MSETTFSATEAALWTGGVWQGPHPATFSALSTDTRDLPQGCLFAALRGERFDGHAFVSAALSAGAAAALCEEPGPGARLLVRNSATALRDLARGYLARVAPTVLGVTGSAGKTTTKELSAHLLGALGPVAKTLGNWNNALGLPKSILSIPSGTRFAVLEAGTNHPGEIAPLAALMRPAAAILTNVEPVHIGNFGSVEAIAEEKADLLRAVPESGFAVLDATLPHFRRLSDACSARVISTCPIPGAVEGADYEVLSREISDGSFEVFEKATGMRCVLRTGRPGRHEIADALLAVAAARAFGVEWCDIATRLPNSPRAAMRWETSEKDGVRYINDAYNANPAAMASALEAFAATALPSGGRRIAVLGDMGELGDVAPEMHRKTGALAASAKLDRLICVGPLSRFTADGAIASGMSSSQVALANDAAQARALLSQIVSSGDVVLVKASRSMALEGCLPQGVAVNAH